MTIPHTLQHSGHEADTATTTEQEVPSIFSEFDLYLFGQGKNYRIYEKMGAHVRTVSGVSGGSFAVWAPNSMMLTLPPLSTVILKRRPYASDTEEGIALYEPQLG